MSYAVTIAVTVIVAYITYRVTRRTKEPTWAIRTSNLVHDYSERLPRLAVTYGGQAVQNLSVSRIAFWNSGKDTIERDDMASTDVLRIQAAEGVKLLDVSLLQKNYDPTLLSVALQGDGQAALIDFEFFDRGHGGVFEIIHTGATSKDVQIAGTIKGDGIPRRRAVTAQPKYPWMQQEGPTFWSSRVILALSTIITATLWGMIGTGKFEHGSEWPVFVAAGYFPFAVLTGALMLLLAPSEIPRGLGAFTEIF